jgi:hypothetical protein
MLRPRVKAAHRIAVDIMIEVGMVSIRDGA